MNFGVKWSEPILILSVIYFQLLINNLGLGDKWKLIMSEK